MRFAQRLLCLAAGQPSADGRRLVLVSPHPHCNRPTFYLTGFCFRPVPILPHFVHHDVEDGGRNANGTATTVVALGNDSVSQSSLYNLLKSSAELIHIGRGYQPDVGDNSRLGFLLSLKAIVQLAANPLVAVVTQRRGFALPLLVGTVNLILCALRKLYLTRLATLQIASLKCLTFCAVFAFGRSFLILSTARALQGITSACFTIAGLGLVASTFKEETKRSAALGRALGGGAVGVLLGYPIGGFLYQLTGKAVPFLLITSLAVALLGNNRLLLLRRSNHRMESAYSSRFFGDLAIRRR